MHITCLLTSSESISYFGRVIGGVVGVCGRDAVSGSVSVGREGDDVDVWRREASDST